MSWTVWRIGYLTIFKVQKSSPVAESLDRLTVMTLGAWEPSHTDSKHSSGFVSSFQVWSLLCFIGNNAANWVQQHVANVLMKAFDFTIAHSHLASHINIIIRDRSGLCNTSNCPRGKRRQWVGVFNAKDNSYSEMFQKKKKKKIIWTSPLRKQFGSFGWRCNTHMCVMCEWENQMWRQQAERDGDWPVKHFCRVRCLW